MLTEIEKQILGHMVDAGSLRGTQRVSASQSDEIARELIAAFKDKMQATLPPQIEGLKAQELLFQTNRAKYEDILQTLQSYEI